MRTNLVAVLLRLTNQRRKHRMYAQRLVRRVAIILSAFKLTKQLACSPSEWIWFVFTYRSNQSH